MNSSNDPRDVLLNRALAILNALELRYAIMTPDGEKHGTLEVAPPKSTRVKFNFVKLYNYPDRLNAMRVGGTEVFDCTPDHAESLRASMVAYAAKRSGRGAATSHVSYGVERSQIEFRLLYKGDPAGNPFASGQTDAQLLADLRFPEHPH